MKSILGIAALAVLGFISCSEPDNSNKKDKVEENGFNVPREVEKAAVTEKPAQTDIPIAKKIPKYKVLHRNTTYCQYEVLISPVNLNSLDYKADIRAILNDMAAKYQSTNLTTWFYDNERAAKLNYDDLELGKHLSKSETKLVNYHIVAVYDISSDGRGNISFFENIPSEDRAPHKAWKDAYIENEFNQGFTPVIK